MSHRPHTADTCPPAWLSPARDHSQPPVGRGQGEEVRARWDRTGEGGKRFQMPQAGQQGPEWLRPLPAPANHSLPSFEGRISPIFGWNSITVGLGMPEG